MIDRNDPKLTAYVLGELDASECAEFERVIAGSAELQAAIAEIRLATKSLEAYFSQDAIASSEAALGESLVGKIIAEREIVAEDVGVSLASAARPRRKLAWLFGVVSAGLLGLAAIFVVLEVQSNRREEQQLVSTLGKRIPAAGTREIVIDDGSAMSSHESADMSRMMSNVPRGAMGVRVESEDRSLDVPFKEGSFQNPIPQFGGFDANASEGRPDGFFAGGASGAANTFSGHERMGDGEPGMGSGGMGMGSGMMGGAGSPSHTWIGGNGPSSSMGLGGQVPGGMAGAGAAQGRLTWQAENTQQISDERFDSFEAKEPISPSPERPQVVASSPAKAPIAEPHGGDPKPTPTGGNEENGSDVLGTTVQLPTVGDGVASAKTVQVPPASPAARDPQRTWRRAKATPNASRLMIGDEDELPLEGMQTNVVIDGFRARVLIDLYFYNDRQRSLEGSFQLRLPDEASPYYFAFGETSFEYQPHADELASKGFFPTSLVRDSRGAPDDIRRLRDSSWSNVKEARVVPREEAAYAYGETVRRRIDPALVEWAGAGVFNARVFPLAPQKLHRIVIGYDVNLRDNGGDLAFDLALPEHRGECSIDVNVAALPGANAEITPAAEPFTAGGRAYYHYADPKTDAIEVKLTAPGAIVLDGADEKIGDFFATRFTPELPAADAQAGSPRAVFLVDTSLSSTPDRFNLWLKLLEATLNANRDSIDEFAVLFFNIDSHWWKPGFTANTPEAVEELLSYCHTLALEGATDLRQALAQAASPSWLAEVKEAPAKADLFLLSDGAATWGETNLHLVARSLKTPFAGPLYAYRTGLTGTDSAALEHLARESSGAVFSVLGEDEVPHAAVAYRQPPLVLVAVETAGGDDILTAGRVRSIYPGQSVLLVGRGKPAGDFSLTLRRGDETHVVKTPIAHAVASDLAARVYGQTAVGQLEDLESFALDVATAYARHFRVAGQTCSLLMLESEADYERFQIKPEDDAFVVKSTPAADYVRQKLDAAASRLEDPKAQLLDWLEKLANYPGAQFEMSTALKIAIEKMPSEAFDAAPDAIACRDQVRQEAAPKKYFEALQSQPMNYEAIAQEADRRRELGAADRLKVMSNLVEASPGDAVIARDVAFTALELGLPGQALPLLKRVALMRPYEPQVYQAMAQCLTEIGRPDLAIIFYEVAVGGQWHERYRDLHRIAAVDYLRLLRRIDSKQLVAHAAEFAAARRQTLEEAASFAEADLVVSLMWSTDRTDVDLHVIEPSGEECFYQHAQTRSGGELTRDVTEGFGPEMYVARAAQHGKYAILANFYGEDANRTTARTKVYVTIYENYGRSQEKTTRQTVLLKSGKEKREVAAVMVEK